MSLGCTCFGYIRPRHSKIVNKNKILDLGVSDLAGSGRKAILKAKVKKPRSRATRKFRPRAGATELQAESFVHKGAEWGRPVSKMSARASIF